MSLQKILNYLKDVCSNNNEIPMDKFEEIIAELANVVKKQNEMLLDIRNSNVRLENKIKFIENELERSKIYKNIVDVMMVKIKRNPITALMYLYKIKANIDKVSDN